MALTDKHRKAVEALATRGPDEEMRRPGLPAAAAVHDKGGGEAIKAVRHFLDGAHEGAKLVPLSYRSIYNAWVRERERLKLPAELDVHSFRHTFLSWLANRGQVSLTEVAAVAGHSSVAITQVYVHRDEATLRAGMARLDADLVSRWYQDDEDEEKIQLQ